MSTNARRTLVWFRGKDLRLADHAPLASALERGDVVCAFILDPFFFSADRARELPHRMQFLLSSIDALARSIEARGSRLFFATGKSVEVVPAIARRWKVDRVVAHRWSEPFGVERDRRVAASLDVPFDLFEGETLARPKEVRTGAGGPFSVFTPFANAFRKSVAVAKPISAPQSLPPPPRDVHAEWMELPTLASLGITPNDRLPAGGEAAAHDRLRAFARRAARYADERDRLDLDATSRLSVDLKFGTLSARTVWTTLQRALATAPAAWEKLSSELIWREFTHDVLREHPALLDRPHRAAFADSPFRHDDDAWRAWSEGTTGYPVVDAAARQLLAEGFVPNRARMIAASFLTKHLAQDFRLGEAHYLKWLVDGDWAQNDFNWQWVAGCGFDAAPYFRVFNPIEQGKKFDPEGAYVKRWIPELSRLDAAWIHAPWTAPESALREAGVALGETYPRPIVDHGKARARYLEAMKSLLR